MRYRNLRAMIFAMLLLPISSGTNAQPPIGPEKPATWPQWRGPNRDGRINAAVWPDRLDETNLRLSWRVPLGKSYSGPIISEKLVFTTETQDQRKELVRALDRASGKEVWQASWEGSLSVPFFAKSNGDWIRSTPAFDGESLYVAGMRDLLVCVDAQTGMVRWQIDFVSELKSPLPAFGFVCSPLIDGDVLYVQAGASCNKVDKRTGKIIWTTLQDGGGMWGSAFSSPLLAQIAGRKQLLVQTREKLAGIDPESGKVLWSRDIPSFRGMNILTPTVQGDSIFTSAYQGKSWMFNVTQEEGVFRLNDKWTEKSHGYMSSPVIVGEHIYLHLQNQRYACLELATGKNLWTSQPYGTYSSMIANGDKILALDERGELLLIRANPEKFELLDSRKISDDPTWAHLAICGNEVFVRELNAVAAFRWPLTPPAQK